MIGQNDDRRIRYLIETAAQASASGRVQEADRLVRQAEAEAPRHPLVLNESARRLLLRGDAAGAYAQLVQAVKEDPSHASIWLNLAAALRGLKRTEEEMAAIDKVLALEPRNLRAMLQKASLQELQGQPRAAAMTYRYALQSVPSGALPPQSLRPVFQHAMQFVAANDKELEEFLEQRLKGLRERFKDEPLQRFERCLETLLRKKPVYRPQPSFMYFPRLPALEFYERSDFPWLDSIEAATDDIRAELIKVLQEGPSVLTPYVDIPQGMPLDQWRELNQSRRWGVYYLWQEGVAIPDHIARFPRTVAALEVGLTPIVCLGEHLAQREAGQKPSASTHENPLAPGNDSLAAAAYSVISREQKLKIVGVADLDPESMRGPTRGRVFVPLGLAETLHVMQPTDLREISRAAGDQPVYSSVSVRVKNPAQIRATEDAIKKMGFNTFSILDATRSLQQFFAVLDLFLGIFGSLALAVASIGIVNTLVMAILERRREIGIMKAIGASDVDVKKLFFAEAGAMGILGGIVGVVLGWAIGQVINLGTNVYLKRQSLPPEHFWAVPWWLVGSAILFAFLVSLGAGLYPAGRAARLDPVQALRYE